MEVCIARPQSKNDAKLAMFLIEFYYDHKPPNNKNTDYEREYATTSYAE